MINIKLSKLELGAMSKVLNQLFREAVGVDCTQRRIEYVLWLAPTRGPNSFRYPPVVLTSTLLCSVVSIMLAKLYRSALLGLHLAPGLTFIGNTTPGQSERVSQREQGKNKHA